ncbi:unnamed protein product (macronuclear) [Paramecium tetraurelia]|uniref:Major facilitator superfamily (MFS) profile domain-containing protein n=1 Tax=Paramecium tetraurelia TaxID=5888 RepID=A0D2K0_PARTE|nr:uncharacterized protein GSPATT00012775001 [Paramecium tetraurelia]CAK77267.1 unnamed protein product [Paramecium tetraurelia]|eukprot:XP_001444664.1 hypothetical protein (macronuclear) [Paramecium tetraurelia strain d4-2]
MQKTYNKVQIEECNQVEKETKSSTLLGSKIYSQHTYRWIILTCYLVVVFINGISYQTFIPNAKQFVQLYNVDEQIITLTGTIYLIMQPVFTFFASSVIVKKGFAVSMSVGVILTIIGYGIRLLINKYSFIFAILGQLFLGISRPFILNGQTTMAQNWFFPSNRMAVLAACNAFQTFSMVISVLWPANWIFKDYSYNDQNKQEGLDLSIQLQYQQFFLSLTLIPVVFLIKNNPKTPPSGFANSDHDVGFYDSIRKLLKNKNFILILCTFSLYFGTLKGFGLSVPYLMSPFGFVDTDYSIASSLLIIGGFLSAGFVSKLVLKFKKYKAIGIVLFIISLVLTLLTYPILMIELLIPLCIQQFLLGFFLIPMVPVLIEYSCESIYPLNGSFSVGVMVSGATTTAMLSSILLTYTSKGKDSDKTSALVTYIILCCIYLIGFILFLFTKEILNRSKEVEQRASSKQSVFYCQQQLKTSMINPDAVQNEQIVGDYPTEHPILDSHQFIQHPEVLNPDFLEQMQNDEQT